MLLLCSRYAPLVVTYTKETLFGSSAVVAVTFMYERRNT